MITKKEIVFDSRDGKTKIHAFRWIPEGEVVCIFQIVHGMAEYIERYEDLAKYLAQRGILVTGEDHLGHGKSIPEGGQCGYFCEQDPATVVVRDVHRLKKLTQEEYTGIPYYIFGHSMGSFVFRNYLLRYGTGIQGAIISGTGTHTAAEVKAALLLVEISKLFQGTHHVAKTIDKIAFGAYNNRIPNARTSFDWICTDPKVVDDYVADPLCGFTFTVNGFKTLFTLLDRLNHTESLQLMPKDLPVHFIAGAEDPVGNYGKGVQEVYESFKKAGMKNVTMKIYDNCRHEVTNEVNKYEIYADVYEWIMNRLNKPGEEVETENGEYCEK